MTFHKCRKACLCSGKLPFAQSSKGGLKLLLFSRLCCKFLPVHSHLERFNLSQSLINALRQVFLCALHISNASGQLLVLTTQVGHITTQNFNLV